MKFEVCPASSKRAGPRALPALPECGGGRARDCKLGRDTIALDPISEVSCCHVFIMHHRATISRHDHSSCLLHPSCCSRSGCQLP